jgi:hypothetical protein
VQIARALFVTRENACTRLVSAIAVKPAVSDLGNAFASGVGQVHAAMPRSSLLCLARRFRDSSGQSLIEGAIITPLLLLITFAIVDFGWLFFVNLTLESGVSQAARYGVTGRVMDGSTRQESIKSIVRSAASPLTLDDDDFHFSHLVGGNWVDGVGGPGDIGKVAVTYQHRVLVLSPFFSGGQVNLRVESAMKNEDRFE